MTPVFELPTRVADVFAKALANGPEREALVTRSGRWSYRELDHACAQAAGALTTIGVRAGDRVAASLPNDIDLIVAFHGAMRLGAIWVGINQALAPPEQAYLLADSEAMLFICDADAETALDPHRSELHDLQSVVDADAWHAAWMSAAPAVDLPDIDPDTPAGLAYTSGTTGRPKGAIHSQRNLLLAGAAINASREYGPDLRKGDCLPLTILNLMVLTTLLVAQAEGTAVIMDTMWGDGVAEWIERENVTVWNGPPALLHSMIASDNIADDALASLREVWSGGSALPEALRNRFADRFGMPLIGTYGLSEAPTVVSIDPVGGDHVERASGKPLPHLDLQIIGDDGSPVANGELGEICFAAHRSGPYAGLYSPPLGYWKRTEASAELLADGLVHSGDIGLVDADGWLHIRDRKNLVIMRGGANVYPAEIERVLNDVDGVAGSAAVGVDDERLGERVVAAIELDEGASVDIDALLGQCRDQLAKYKVPERIVETPSLPRNAMGKIDRTAVKDLFA